MKSMGDVVAEPVEEASNDDNDEEMEVVRRGSLDSVDRLSLSSTTTNSSILSGGSEIGTRTLRSLKRGLGKLWRRHRGNASITEYDPCYKVAYLGNVLTGWAKGEGCVEKPVSTLWRNYVGSNRPDVSMRLTVTNGGLTATTKDHGLTEYWAHRVTYCTAPQSHPRLFVWVYRHEGRRLRPELRCHAALCSKESTAKRLASVLNARLHQALLEFRRDKVSRQNARLSLANAVYENPSLPRRKLLLSTGGSNYRPPLERSKSAPKLSAIEEDAVAEELEQQRFLEELSKLEQARERCALDFVARSWQEQDGWRLARLLDALQRDANSDENGSISSGCETASTANSEERVSSSEDSQLPHEPEMMSGPATSAKALTTAMTSGMATAAGGAEGPRRNSEGSPNFMTCAGSPRFRRRSSRHTRNHRKLCSQGGPFSGEESMEDEDEDAPMEETAAGPRFEFEDVQDLDEIVDFRPHGESLRTSCVVGATQDGYSALFSRRDDMRKVIGSRRSSRDEIDACVTEETTTTTTTTTNATAQAVATFHTLGSLDEEEAADSDESGYVEASPKSSIDRTEIKCRKDELQPISQENNVNNNNNDTTTGGKEEVARTIKDTPAKANGCSAVEHEFIKCPISETIKQLANASLRSSKVMRASANACLESLNKSALNKPDIDGESPSLLQRKQLLAQHGVTV